MKKFAVRVRLTEEDGSGYIIRRLDASSYEILTDDGRTMVIAPEQFEEVEDED